MVNITINDLTEATLTGTGVFDVLMRANKAHLEAEFVQNRIKGSEYSSVYLGSVTQIMQTALAFLMQREKISLEAQLLEQQVILAQVEVQKANAELQIVQATLAKIPLEIEQLRAQADLVKQQAANALAEHALIVANGLKIPAEIALLEQQKLNLISTELQIDAQTSLITQQKENAVVEHEVLLAQVCKLKAEFDLLVSGLAKSGTEIQLLAQKIITEKAQVSGMNIDDESVIGKQIALYAAQTAGYARDAEQKLATLLVNTWNVRRTTDEATVADGVNMLNDASVGRVVNKAMLGINA